MKIVIYIDFMIKEYNKFNKCNKIVNNNRKVLWFEKFNWFISSDGYLVISGKTAHMNETIIKKHMEEYDIYVHSDIPGSGSCIIKNTSKDKLSIPFRTLEYPHSFCVD